MKVLRYISLFVAVLCLLVSCKKEDPDVVTADVKEFSINGDGESVKVNITANRQWIASTENDWITLPNSQSESGTSQLTIRVKKNETESGREGSVKVIAGDASVTIKIVQRLRIVMDLDISGAYIEFSGDTIDVQMSSNADYSVEIVEGSEWITMLETKAVVTDYLQFVVAENSEKSTRKGKIVFTEPAEGKRKEFLVNQYGMPDLVTISYSGSEAYAPNFDGKAPKINVEWGDGTSEEYYKKSPKHSYEQSGDYIIKTYVRESSSFTINSLHGISSIDLSDY